MSVAVFAAANRRRAIDAAARTIAAVQEALRLLGPDNLPAHLAEAAKLRIAHPDASLAELAAMTDLTKDMLRGHLRTLLARAERARAGLRLDPGGPRAGAGMKVGGRRVRRPVRSAGPLTADVLARLRRDVGVA